MGDGKSFYHTVKYIYNRLIVILGCTTCNYSLIVIFLVVGVTIWILKANWTVAEQPMHLEVGHCSSEPAPVVLDLQSL